MKLPTQPLCIGARITGEPVMLDSDERRRHLYLVGQTGTGKSTLLLNLIWQDLLAGDGLALLDPHGDLPRTCSSAPTSAISTTEPRRNAGLCADLNLTPEVREDHARPHRDVDHGIEER